MTAPSILIVDDDPDVAYAAQLQLKRLAPGRITTIQHPSLLNGYLEHTQPQVVLLDLNFTPGRTDGGEGLAVLDRLRQLPRPPAVIALTAYADVPLAVEALKRGAIDFITKPWDNAKLTAVVAAAVARWDPENAVSGMAGTLIGQSRVMVELRALIARVAPTGASVMILGENGVGKELVARAIHDASSRAAQKFLAVDMGSIPESTFESELFGHRRGAFTDARADRAGRFQVANGGTLFLDEIGNLSLASQAKLLTALERRQVTPVGADLPQSVDVRIVSATNIDEASLYNPQAFRTDLLFRLNTITIRVPPLRERRDDIPELLQRYLKLYASQYEKPVGELPQDVVAQLAAQRWAGNVRALRSACERAVILSNHDRYGIGDFALDEPLSTPQRTAEVALNLDARERDAVRAAMDQSDGNISQAAKLLGLSRAALYRRLEKYGL
ncbi:MAG: sigma-54 dependent transcriptional regulator [Nevskia sp.]|jgi:DNA-binding NtrC family response regulator|nr:sigma-54 dependent transcriptional regulator [Nevskia sp.]